MPRPNVQFTSVVWDGKVYFAGGNQTVEFTNIVDIYDVKNNTWSLDTLSEPKIFAAPAVANEKLFFGGGITAFGNPIRFTDQVDIFDLESNSWSTIQLSEEKATTAVASGGKVYFAGGITFGTLSNGFVRTTNVVDIYDIESGELSTATLSEEKAFIGAATANGILLFAQGQSTGVGEISNFVDLYDSNTDRWSKVELSEPRTGAGVVIALEDRIFIAGGATENGMSDRVDIYNTTDGSWSFANLSLARTGIAAAVVGKKIYFVGGGELDIENNFFTSSSSRVDIYDSATNTWSMDELSFPRVNHTVASVDNRLIVAGGIDLGSQVVLDVIEIFTDTSSVTNIDQIDKPFNFTIYPNPAKEKIVLSVPIQNDYTNYDLSITNLDGKELLRQKINTRIQEMDISHLASGNYLISLTEVDAGKIYTKQIVID